MFFSQQNQCKNQHFIIPSPWPDFVFASDYKLKNLSEVEHYVSIHKLLPDMPSAAQIENEGKSLAALQKLQQQKLEELFL